MRTDELADWLRPALSNMPTLPLQQRLYQALREAILDGRLRAGERLPATRALAGALGVARNTALAALARLQAEGYALARHGAGSFVATSLPERYLHSRPPRAAATRSTPPRLSQRSRQWLAVEDSPGRRSAGAFVPGMPDLRGFPFQHWWRLLHRHERDAPWQALDYGRGGGLPALQAAISAHLRLTRSVRCEPGQVVITAGTQQSLDLCCRVLADPGDRFAIEEPGYLGARLAALANGLRLQPVPVDADGLQAERLRGRPPRLVYVTPSHQFPLGMVMALGRRQALLDYADQHQAYVLEDDYDAEFRFAGPPLASLQGLDRRGRVIYLGTFSKVLYPALRLAYMVVPEGLVDAFCRSQERLYGCGHAATQSALAEFIASGRFASHLRRMRIQYGERNRLLQELLAAMLPGDWQLLGIDAGQHCTLLAADPIDDIALSRQADAGGLTLQPLSPHYLGRRRQAGFVLGYAAADARELRRGVRTLQDLLLAPPHDDA